MVGKTLIINTTSIGREGWGTRSRKQKVKSQGLIVTSSLFRQCRRLWCYTSCNMPDTSCNILDTLAIAPLKHSERERAIYLLLPKSTAGKEATGEQVMGP